MNKKYIAPFDMFDGKVKKDDVFRISSSLWYQSETKDIKYLPKEIVETWEEYVEFKKGDFVTLSEGNTRWVFIFEKLENDILNYFSGVYFKDGWSNYKKGTVKLVGRKLTHSTQEEKDLLISKLKEQGKYYDVESHSIKDVNPHQDMIDEWEKSSRTKELQYFDNGNWFRASTPTWSKDVKYRFKPQPVYVPFTFEDNNQFRNKWLKHNDGSLHLITSISKSYLQVDGDAYPYQEALEYFRFEDDSIFGKLVES